MPKTAADAYCDTVAAAMRGVLAPMGFRKKGATFAADWPESWAFVNLQRSVRSNASQVWVAVNFGLYPKALYDALSKQRPVTHYSECPFRGRISRGAHGASDDSWWQMASAEDAQIASSEILDRLTQDVLPEMRRVWTLEGFCDAFQSNRFCELLPIDEREAF